MVASWSAGAERAAVAGSGVLDRRLGEGPRGRARSCRFLRPELRECGQVALLGSLLPGDRRRMGSGRRTCVEL